MNRLLQRWLPRVPRRTVRLRLTLLYGSLFLVSGAALLAITYVLVRHSTRNAIFYGSLAGRPKPLTFPPTTAQLRHLQAQAEQVRIAAIHEHAAELHQLLIQSGIALAIMAVISLALGWIVAGRTLSPLRVMTATARRISERNLHERLAIKGPRDELTELAETIDNLLARLENAFGAQRRFVANAAHELRTPLTLERTLLEATVTDPNATLESFRATSAQLLAVGERHRRLLDALLTLATTERGLDHRETFDLAELAGEIIPTVSPAADRLGLQLKTRIDPAPTAGDPRLAARLIANLLDNAIDYNVAGGNVQIETGIRSRRPFLTVSNTGPLISQDDLQRLFEPFQRHGSTRIAHSDHHHGLGLSIIKAIAEAHAAAISARSNPGGGLRIEVTFPSVPPLSDFAARARAPQPSAVVEACGTIDRPAIPGGGLASLPWPKRRRQSHV